MDESLESTKDSLPPAPRVGVYICHCGGNISDVVDVQKVAEKASRLPGVVVARTNMFMCSDPGQKLILEDVQNERLDRVVVASCSPRLHETTFRNAVARAGLNPYLYEHANIREQVSWVTHNDPEAATQKAGNLVAAAVAKALQLESLEPIRVDALKHALVVGGGISGLKTALDISRYGIDVTLVEKTPSLGGHVLELDRVFPTGENARDLLAPLVEAVLKAENIRVLTSAEVVAASGYIGNFEARIRQRPGGVNENQKDTVVEVKAGAIVVATGHNHYEPRRGEYGYGELKEVITLPEFIRLMADASTTGWLEEPIDRLGFRNRVGLANPVPSYLEWQGRPIRNIAMIHCVGSRQIEGQHEPQEDGKINPYCSRVCCTATLQAATEVKERFPETNIFDFYQDIRTYGRGHEDYYEEASKKRTLFFRYAPEEPPVVEAAPSGSSHPIVVRVKDRLTFGEELAAPVDLVVLAVGMVPQSVPDLVEALKLPVGSDRFLLEVHPKLRPVEVAVNGVLLAGTSQGPKDITESAASASAAAVKAAASLARGYVELDPFVAVVDAGKCDGCGECIPACGYKGTIALVESAVNSHSARRAQINPALCKGCGACVSLCPSRAIDLNGWTLEQYEAMVDAILAEDPVAVTK